MPGLDLTTGGVAQRHVLQTLILLASCLSPCCLQVDLDMAQEELQQRQQELEDARVRPAARGRLLRGLVHAWLAARQAMDWGRLDAGVSENVSQ